MATFRREFEQALPSGLFLAPELVELLDWIEDQSLVSTDEETDQRFATRYSEDPWESNQPAVLFEIAQQAMRTVDLQAQDRFCV